eukprot:2029245-Rhodomonas_salina.1
MRCKVQAVSYSTRAGAERERSQPMQVSCSRVSESLAASRLCVHHVLFKVPFHLSQTCNVIGP